ncbi:MAG: phospho-N-acetylmuramoyl-pentapeptide-transferase [Ardenticatenaceae bacterium]|nr:phospho-N-acetylmuramoyl-pentapeptide-transferase [Ardenticatenaceae bacterium]HBY97783.1 phospho-N-acetylmuramoyl-pentapeptide-transferase [Chloroflexota bacterium]
MTLFSPQTALALTLGVVSFLFAVIWGTPLINSLRRMQIGESIRIEGPQRHMSKVGTPTMGGLMIIVPTVIFCSLFILPQYHSLLLPLGMLISAGALGMADDLAKLNQKRRGEEKIGILGRHKMLVVTALALFAAIVIYRPLGLGFIILPTVANRIALPAIIYIPIAVVIIVGTTNAVNLTDGLDGLAGGTAAINFATYGVISLRQGQPQLATFCFCMAGGILAFLWYNAYPAQLFMGDTGSLALGATLSTAALMTGQWVLLPIIGSIFVAVTLSVMIQTTYFKITRRLYGTGRRFFKMAPIHHHFELLGWSEVQVVQRFWLISMLTGVLGVALALL